MEFTVSQVAALINGTVEGDGSQKVERIDKIQEGKKGGISFLSNMKYEPHIYGTASSAVIVSEDFSPSKPLQTTLIRVKDPYSGFTQLLEAYAQLTKHTKTGVEEPSFMDKTSKMQDGGYRGAFSYIGKNCSIGQQVSIHAQAYIGDNVKIGDRTIIHPGARIYSDTIIGNDCEIHPNVVIGADGFGFAPQEDKSYKNIPQLGNVILEDHVSVGSGSTIDCATMGSTLIKKGVKIDNLVQIAHNVIIGEHTVIAAQAGISGSTEIGKNCVIAGQVGIVGHLKIADNTTIGAKTGVSKSILESGKTIFGYMGYEMKEFLKSYSIFKKLPSLQDRVKELEKKQ
ncbi:UDP-3-O-(3-hydroxymyristoyl)glucosamine N-acyltransferase [Echinicola vietnamensis]|uniref:UDP-3-O-acylglucosamine N-acyltransferase n=1 Tax=Echinicola vietnamensis (strain DSM 17526 / LMG 23754 / KMM 6221) TaxID=926556 RepID=L0G116_ECHVK|nr:UDP-3-O-(3-hydroxymyristoyl)glucosamine N-acyltransferase [Echinicola vietnamensis]AGA78510.1 UDP-3-O-(3-hydroxymyristoyl) glucosamine N-acyltransferase [Echinicola vietnamensis DSM 17526]